jgi:uncharacterized membrane protein YcjF (UPF0283 family)
MIDHLIGDLHGTADWLRGMAGSEGAMSVLRFAASILDEYNGLLKEMIRRNQRINELLQNGNRLLQEARDERAAHERTREELAVWRELALTLRASLKLP